VRKETRAWVFFFDGGGLARVDIVVRYCGGGVVVSKGWAFLKDLFFVTVAFPFV
jgi:hypothetical protein